MIWKEEILHVIGYIGSHVFNYTNSCSFIKKMYKSLFLKNKSLNFSDKTKVRYI